MKFWNAYLRLFGRPAFGAFHTALLKVALRGLGFQAWWSPHVSGEAWLLARLAATTPMPCVLDVGANVGAYCKLVREKAPKARILAIEPNPASFALLAELAAQQGFAARNVAVGRSPGTAVLYHQTSDHTSPHASLLPAVSGGGPAVTSRPVAMATVDQLVQDAGIDRVHLLKIDTEGSELDALLGAQHLIRAGRVDWIQFEFNTMNVAARVFFEDFQAALPDYRFFRLLAAGLMPISNSPWALPNLFMFQNLVAVRPGAPTP